MTPWESIINEHGPALWRTAWRIVGNAADADECLQETFVAAVGIARRGEVHSWSALLRRLVVLRGIDCLRRRARDPLRCKEHEDLSTVTGRELSPDVIAQDGEVEARLRWTLAKLPARQAQVACLRYLEEMSYEEISQQLHISVRNVGVILSRARETLRGLLKERGADNG